jgi:hypothetical protein
MHIEFNLPTGAGGQSACYFNTVLDQQLTQWSIRYHINYTKTLTYYKASIWLPAAEDYTVFALTWHWATPRWIVRERD